MGYKKPYLIAADINTMVVLKLSQKPPETAA